MMPFSDYHMHTPLCGHAKGDPQEYAKQAKADMGFKQFAFVFGALGRRVAGGKILGYGATYGSGVRRARKVAWAAARSRRQAGTARQAERGGVALLLGRPPPRVRASGAVSVRASERAE